MLNPILSAVSTGSDVFSDILLVFLAFLLAIVFIVFLFHLIVAFFIYRDAKEHGMSANLWALIIIMLPAVLLLFGLVMYFIAVLVVAVAYAVSRSNASGGRCLKYSGGRCVKRG
jgi:RsiW-degrading membrane proteinase PrsW (M82 family)